MKNISFTNKPPAFNGTESIGIIMGRMTVSSQNSYVKALTFNVMVFGGGRGLQEVIRIR